MLQKICAWYDDHRHTIEPILSVLALVELFVIVLALMALVSTIDIMHGMEVQLAAHGLEWALYTPIP